MLKLVSILLLSLCSAAQVANGNTGQETNGTNVNDMKPLILGGSEVAEGTHPWVVGLRESAGGVTLCGGSLISSRYILSAAHCGSRAFSHAAIGTHYKTGTADGERIRIRRKIIHPKYNADTISHDFMLLELEEPSKYDPVNLGTDTGEEVANPAFASTMGWGATREGGSWANGGSSDVLLFTILVTWSKEKCTTESNLSKKVDSSMLCAGGHPGMDSCQGDSGGPLTAVKNEQEVLVGVVSWGDGCGRDKVPGVYGRVSAAADFIRQNVPGAVFSE